MRYVQKMETPQFFIDNTHDLTIWSEYYADKKRILKEYILQNEQKYLCIYCESKVGLDSSHIEHIKPKAQDKYPELTFEYSNLSVSCNGTCNNETDDNTQHNCGHIKKNAYDEDKFLNPIELVDIRDYFEYDIDSYSINSSNKNLVKANYMITTLKLDSGRLKVAREKIYKRFKQEVSKIENISKRKQIIQQRLSKEDIEQVSFLRYTLKNFLK